MALATGLMLVGLSACAATDEPLLGTVLTTSDPAPPFRLHDHFGQQVALSDFDGRVVLLTFLYTYCQDVCPMVAGHLRETYRQLGDDAGQVAFVVISVDPARDTIQRAHEYSTQWDMQDKWAFLVGDHERLSPVWEAYYIDPQVDEPDHAQESADSHRSEDERGSAKGLRRDVDARYTVSHSAPVYLIDRDGRMRVLFTSPLDPQNIVHDIRLLLQ